MPFENSENNRSLTPTGNKVFPTVSTPVVPGPMPEGLLSMKPLRSAPTREQMGDPNLSGGLKMARTKTAPPPSPTAKAPSAASSTP